MFIQGNIFFLCCAEHNSHTTLSVRFDVWSHSIFLADLFRKLWVLGGGLRIWPLTSCEIARKPSVCILRWNQLMFIIQLMRTKMKLLQKTLLPLLLWIDVDLTGDLPDFHCDFWASVVRSRYVRIHHGTELGNIKKTRFSCCHPIAWWWIFLWQRYVCEHVSLKAGIFTLVYVQ